MLQNCFGSLKSFFGMAAMPLPLLFGDCIHDNITVVFPNLYGIYGVFWHFCPTGTYAGIDTKCVEYENVMNWKEHTHTKKDISLTNIGILRI